MLGQFGRQGGGEASVAGDERAPAAVLREPTHPVAHSMVGDPWTDCGDDSGEIHPQLGQTAVDGREESHRDEHVGEVDAGRVNCDLDLTPARLNPVVAEGFKGLQVARGANL